MDRCVFCGVVIGTPHKEDCQLAYGGLMERENKMNIDTTLNERGGRYGKFTGHAQITQDLKATMQAAPKWRLLEPDQKEALEMIAHKIGRILNGDPNYHDSWHDIVGYTKLVADRLLTGETR